MRSSLICTVVVSSALALGLMALPAQASPAAEHACVVEGINLNELFGISERIIGPRGCRQALAGEHWVRSFPSWGTAAGPGGAQYPDGYTPSDPVPMDDFVSKFVGVRVVQDIDTPQERSVRFGPEVLRTIREFDGIPFAFFASFPLHPLSVGAHTTTVFMTLSAEHCDGLSPDREADCLPAGEFQYTGNTRFSFAPPSN